MKRQFKDSFCDEKLNSSRLSARDRAANTKLDIMWSMHRCNEFARRTTKLKNMFDDLGKATQGVRLKSLSEFASVKAAYANVSTDHTDITRSRL